MSRTTTRLLLLIGVGTAVRAVVAATAPLINDEALYWVYARHLDWSYLHQPPMIAYLIALTTLAGDAAFWVRLSSLLLGVATSSVLFLLGRDLFDERAGLLAVAIFQATPLLFGTALLATPDAPLALAWVLALRFVWQALHGRPRRWYGAGLAMGLGCLSKLYMATLGLGIVLYVLARERAWLRRREPYVGAALALVLFLPVLDWNARHDWAAFRYTVVGRGLIDPFGAPSGLQGLWLLLQLYLPFVALLAPAFAWAGWQSWRRRADPRYAFLGWAALPLTVFTFIVAARWGAVRGHWLGPVHLCLALALGSLWRPAVAGLAWTNAALSAAVFAILVLPWLPPLPGASEIYGWPEAAARVQGEVRRLDARMVVANRWEIAAQVAYYTRNAIPVVLLEWPGTDPVWSPPQRHEGETAVAVTDARWEMSPTSCFEIADESRFTVTFRRRPIRGFRLFRLFDFRLPCPLSTPPQSPG